MAAQTRPLEEVLRERLVTAETLKAEAEARRAEAEAEKAEIELGHAKTSPHTMSDAEIKHLEMIQGVVARLAGNSFLLKGWTVTVAAALFALAAQAANPAFAEAALFPAMVFWGLDAYYLRRERLFRCLYDAVRTGRGTGPHLVEACSMATAAFTHNVPSWMRTLMSPSIGVLHGGVVLVMGVTAIILSL